MEFRPLNPFLTALQTPNSPDVAMQFDHVLRSRHIMQAIYILGNQSKAGRAPFEFNKGHMAGIRLGGCGRSPPFFIPGPDELRIARECFGCRQILKPVLLPVTAVAAKDRNAALCGHARPGQNGNAKPSPPINSRKVFPHGR